MIFIYVIKFFQQYQHAKLLKKARLDFFVEVAKNLEHYYVHDQRQTLQKYRTEAWQNIQSLDAAMLSDAVKKAYQAIEHFNYLFDDFREYEKWYTADAGNKTRDNAQTLHAKRHALAAAFKNMDKIIQPAVVSVQNKLKEFKLIK